MVLTGQHLRLPHGLLLGHRLTRLLALRLIARHGGLGYRQAVAVSQAPLR